MFYQVYLKNEVGQRKGCGDAFEKVEHDKVYFNPESGIILRKLREFNKRENKASIKVSASVVLEEKTRANMEVFFFDDFSSLSFDQVVEDAKAKPEIVIDPELSEKIESIQKEMREEVKAKNKEKKKVKDAKLG